MLPHERPIGPEFPDMLTDLCRLDAIQKDEQEKYLYNYNFLQENRKEIKETHPFHWIASLDSTIYIDKSYYALTRRLDDVPNSTYAYIEQVF